MSLTLLQLYVFVLAGFVGFLVITRVPPLLHTPLMSATNAISAISLVGSLVAATSNIVGGFIITDRMLKMFKREPKPDAKAPGAAATPPAAK